MPVRDHEHGMRVELVAAPSRYPRVPLLLLILIAIVPAIALVVLYSWSSGVADDHERSEANEVPFESDVSAAELARAPAPELTTAMLDYRRTPDRLVADANANRLGAEMEPLYTFVDQNSCIAITVDGEPVRGVNEQTPVIPASTMKVLTAAVALDALGRDFRYTTRVATAPVEAGVVTGDLYLIGGGDPLLTSNEFPIADDPVPPFNTTPLDALADQVAAAGITRIDGDVVGDGTRYDDEWFVDSWGPGVAFVDGGPYDALMVNDSRLVGSTQLHDDPNLAAAREFARMLSDRGISVRSSARSAAADPAATEIASIQSAPLSDVVTEMLINSDNNTAELLLKEIGYQDTNDGSRVAGINAVDRRLLTWGIDTSTSRFVDGSGLSPVNRLTCQVLVEVLQRARPLGLRALLPTAGESGALAGEFVDTPMVGRMHAKTGTLGNPPFDADPPAVKGLAGYIDTAGDEVIEFAIILNTPDVTVDRKFEPLWLSFAQRVSTYPAGPATADIGPR